MTVLILDTTLIRVDDLTFEAVEFAPAPGFEDKVRIFKIVHPDGNEIGWVNVHANGRVTLDTSNGMRLLAHADDAVDGVRKLNEHRNWIDAGRPS